jgi:hypothetical protein
MWVREDMGINFSWARVLEVTVKSKHIVGDFPSLKVGDAWRLSGEQGTVDG